ncbi:MAG: hypothetical protein IJN50_05860 [Clostridia bacterium]|nr:hypothetical protein [Clostridia bacterium]
MSKKAFLAICIISIAFAMFFFLTTKAVYEADYTYAVFAALAFVQLVLILVSNHKNKY